MTSTTPRFQSKRAIVTGGAGFIGAQLCSRLLKEGFGEVLAIDNLRSGDWSRSVPGVIRFERDICEISVKEWEDLFRDSPYVFHLAAEKYNSSRSTPEQLLATNIDATERLIRSAATANVEKIFFSSSLYAYGSMGPKIMVEDDQPRGLTLYGSSKLFGEHLLETYGRTLGLKWSCARLFFIYGPHQFAEGGYKSVILSNFERIRSEQPPTIRGDGQQRLDYVYIEDCIDAILTIALSPRCSEVVNISTGTGHSINELTNLMTDIADSQLKETLIEADWTHGSVRVGSTEKMKKIYGWEATTSIQQGLASVFEWLETDHD